jgi:signal transduction histidine kinase
MTRNRNPAIPKVPASSATAIRFVSLVLVFVTIVALGAVAYFTERGIVVSRDWVIHTYQVRSQLNDLELEVVRAEANEKTDLLLPGNQSSTPVSGEQAVLARQTVDELRRLTTDNPGQQLRLEQLTRMLDESIPLFQDHADSRGIRVLVSPSERSRQEEIRDREKQIASIVSSLKDEEESLLDQRLKAWDYMFKRNVLMLGLAFAVVTLMLAYNFRLLVTEVARTRDIEERSRANAQSYRLMSARILELQDLERRRIARELHDSVGQYLAGLKINLNQLESGRIDASTLLRETISLTDCAIQEVRTISHLLHPPLLEELGFLSAARWYLDEYGKRSQIKVSLHVDEPIGRLPREIEIALFRVLQESLTNVYRHAAAQSVHVRIVCQAGHVTLTVADDGTGIPQEVLARFRGGAAPGIGLAGMRERLAEFGGEIKVESSSGGSVVEAVIPTSACEPKSKASPDEVGV